MIVRIQDDILKSLDSHKYVILVLLDLSSAFDSVDHDIFMNKLYKIGVRGRAYSSIKSYLSSRTQAVEIGEAISKKNRPSTLWSATRQRVRAASL